jgi:hypothetical protein
LSVASVRGCALADVDHCKTVLAGGIGAPSATATVNAAIRSDST